MRSPPEPRHSCRALGALLASAAGLACTTTTRLGPPGDPATALAIEALAARPDAYARLGPQPPQPITRADAPVPVIGHEPGWLTVSANGGAMRVPSTQVQSVSTYDHGEGAIDGALAAGAVGLVLGFVPGALVLPGCGADAPCGTSPRAVRGLEIGAVVGAITAALGATVGAVMGHETRYELETATAR